MKKLLLAFALIISLTFFSFAQEKKSAEAKAKEDLKTLISVVNLEETRHETYYRLFLKKHKELETLKLAEEKGKLLMSIEAKLQAGLDEKQMKALQNNPEAFKKLISE